MKKASIMAICLAMTAMLSACGSGTQTENNGNSSSDAAVTEAVESNAESSEADTADSSVPDESSEDAPAEDNISKIMEYEFHLPAEFESAHEGHRRIYKTDTASGSRVWYSLINVADYAINNPDVTYTVDDAPEILWEYLLEDLRALDYPAAAQKSECVVDTDEKKQMLGNDVIRRTGTLKLESYGKTADLAYTAYYMVSDMQNGDYPKVPVVWIVFSEDASDETKAYIEESADYTFEKSEIAS